MTRELKSAYLKVIDLLHSDSADVSCDVSAGTQTITSCACAHTDQVLLDMTKPTGVGTGAWCCNNNGLSYWSGYPITDYNTVSYWGALHSTQTELT